MEFFAIMLIGRLVAVWAVAGTLTSKSSDEWRLGVGGGPNYIRLSA
jgi:hypothetical protein